MGKNLTLLAGAVVVLVLSGCQSMTPTGPQSREWHSVDHSDLRIQLNEADVGVVGHSARSRLVQGRFQIHDGQWRGENGWPRVRLLVHDLSNSRVTFAEDNAFNRPLEERISKAFAEFSISLGNESAWTNNLGTIKTRRFSVNEVNECVFVSQFAAPSNELRAGDGEELGQIYIEGSYCTKPGMTISEADIASFVSGIKIRG